MKNINFIILLISINSCTYSQFISQGDLVGVWQSETEEVASAWLDTYQFFSDGRFIFNLNQYDETRRVNAIKGHYMISADTLEFKVESTVELFNGYFERNVLTSVHGSWSLAGDIIQKEVQQPVQEEYAIIKRCNETTNTECILIDGAKYFKLSTEPEDYPSP